MPRFEIPQVRPGGSLFRSGDAWHDAILDVYHPSWSVYAEGYRLAADHVVDRALARRSERDFLIYPALFLYRQFLELSLKEIIFYAEELGEGTVGNRPAHHRLDALWKRLHGAIKGVSDGSLNAALDVLRSTVIQFAELDPTSEAFRYPENKKGLPVERPTDRVSLPSLRDEMRNAATAIQVVSGGLSALLDRRQEFMGEMGP